MLEVEGTTQFYVQQRMRVRIIRILGIRFFSFATIEM